MKKWLIVLFMLPVLCFAGKTNRPWEGMSPPTNDYTRNVYRMSVPNGWVVYARYGESVSMVFVPDQNHEWNLENKP